MTTKAIKMYDRASSITLFFGIVIMIFGLLAGGCAHVRDRGVFYSEQGLVFAEAKWDEYYYEKLEECKDKFPPKTPEAEACFRPTFEANKLVEEIVEESVRILRDYWKLRAEGYEPDFKSVARHIGDLLNKLPERAKRYFLRVKGL